jgi:hypothetical protein
MPVGRAAMDDIRVAESGQLFVLDQDGILSPGFCIELTALKKTETSQKK